MARYDSELEETLKRYKRIVILPWLAARESQRHVRSHSARQ